MPPPSPTLEGAPSKKKTMLLLEEEEEEEEEVSVVVGSIAAVAAASSAESLRTSSHVKGADDGDDPSTTEAKTAADILARDDAGGAVYGDNTNDTNGSAAAAAAAAVVASRKAGAAEATGATSAAAVPEDGDEDDDDGDDSHPLLLLPSLRDVLECQISSWYPAFAKVEDDDAAAAATEAAAASFERQHPSPQGDGDTRTRRRRRRRLTIRTVIVDLPDSFVRSYLQSGQTVRLPPGSVTSSILRTGPPLWNEDDSDAWSSDGSSAEAEAEPQQSIGTELDQPNHNDDNDELTLLDERIRSALDELGGSIMPKLNWSAPKDASWINAGSLKCQTPGDVYLLLQSSDFVSYDLCHALQDVAPTAAQVEDDQECSSSSSKVDDDAASTPTSFSGYQLALRKWCHLYPSHEFRCFVKSRKVVAISQRHSTSHFPHLVQHNDKIRDALVDFHDMYVKNRFAMNLQGVPVVSNYVLDVYMDRHDKVWIVDFNVWGSRTDSLLFTWKELESMTGGGAPEAAVMRVVETAKQVRHDPLSSYRAPIDAVHVASLTGGGVGGARAFQEFAKLCRRPSDLDDDDDGSSSSSSSASDCDETEGFMRREGNNAQVQSNAHFEDRNGLHGDHSR